MSDVRFFCPLFSVLYLLSFVAGCETAASKKPTSAEQIQQLNDEKAGLLKQIEQAESENEQLKKRLDVLAGLPEKVKAENLQRLQSIKITRYTNFYDKDEDGTKEKLIVYIQPIDDEGDIVKIPGAVDVQLWDLNKENGHAKLGQWQVNSGELKKLWFTTFLNTGYRLMFDIADKIQKFEEPLTVKATFTDYLTGRVFQEQRIIKPLAP